MQLTGGVLPGVWSVSKRKFVRLWILTFAKRLQSFSVFISMCVYLNSKQIQKSVPSHSAGSERSANSDSFRLFLDSQTFRVWTWKSWKSNHAVDCKHTHDTHTESQRRVGPADLVQHVVPNTRIAWTWSLQSVVLMVVLVFNVACFWPAIRTIRRLKQSYANGQILSNRECFPHIQMLGKAFRSLSCLSKLLVRCQSSISS